MLSAPDEVDGLARVLAVRISGGSSNYKNLIESSPKSMTALVARRKSLVTNCQPIYSPQEYVLMAADTSKPT